MSAFRSAYPIDFKLLNDQDQHVIYITDEPLAQEVKLEITNNSPQLIKLESPRNATAGRDNYHFELRFRRGTLDDATRKNLTVAPAGEWKLTRSESNGDADSLYLLNTAVTPTTFDPGKTLLFTLTNLSADIRGGSRGSRAELRYRSQPDNGQIGITGHRETHFNIVNRHGQQHIPLHVGFVGSNTILNDGSSRNTLTLRIMNVSNDRSIPWSNDPTRPTKLIISFDTQDSRETKDWALATTGQANGITIDFKPTLDDFTPEGSTPGKLGESPAWTYKCVKSGELVKYAFIDIEITNIVTSLPIGQAKLYLDYENIPGYWDGNFACTIEKSPVVIAGERIETGRAVMSGAVNDYQKAQTTLAGGGNVTWKKPWLHWTHRFIANGMGFGDAIPDGIIEAAFPKNKDLVSSYDGANRWTAEGINLGPTESLYAVHTIGGRLKEVRYQIAHCAARFEAPSNWLLIAVHSIDDGSLKLGTGATLSDNSALFDGSPIPRGMIMMWSGDADKIPFGWAVCDGSTPGVPNLVGRFVMGANASSDPKPKSMGEADTHTHKISEFTVSTDNAGDHTHHSNDQSWYRRWLQMYYESGPDADKSNGKGYFAYTVVDCNNCNVKDANTGKGGNHSHQLTIGEKTTTPSTATNRPKWYALCYIMKL